MRRAHLVAAVALGLVVSTAPAAQALTREIGPNDPAAGDSFGTSIALDGNTMVVGSPYKATGTGAAYVFTRTANETWTQTAKLTASDAATGDNFGMSVSIDASTIVVGASGEDNGAGAVYTFARSGGDRTEVEKLVASDRSQGDALGYSVAVDGDTIVAGAPDDDLPGEHISAGHGSVYTFATTGTAGRNQSAKLTASDNNILGYTGAGSRLGESVAIDGDTIVAGAPSDLRGNVSGPRFGAAYTFSRTGDPVREETAKLTVTGQATGRVGQSVDVLGDTIVAGDVEADGAQGAAWLFARTGGDRTQSGKLTPSQPSANKQFGYSVAMSSSYIVVGATSWAVRGTGFVFTRTGAANRTETWTTTGKTAFAERYGASIATDGDRVVAGAPLRGSPDGRGYAYSSIPELTVSKTGTGSGAVAPDQTPLACETPASSCVGAFLLGDQVTMTATPSPGSYFAGWSNYAPCNGSTAPCVVTMDREPQLVATFTLGSPPVDTTPATVTIVGGPAQGSTITTGATAYSFSADENVTFQCKVDSGAYGPCSTSTATSGTHGLTGLAEGPHTFAVRATDTAGNPSVEKTRTFTVDLPPPPDKTPPQTTVTTKPPRKVFTSKKKAKVTLGFTASERATFLCKVDDAAYKSCRSPFKVRLAVGKHTLLVVAVDAAGNHDATPAKVVVKVKKKQG